MTTVETEERTDQPSRIVRAEMIAFQQDGSLLAAIAHKADLAARNRKLKSYGFEAVDVYQEVVVTILGRLRMGETLQGILTLEDREDDEATSVSIGRLAAAAAERIIYRARMERPVGDASAVVGEEVPTEQKVQSQEELTRGNDRQMTAVLSRPARIRSIHRADVYGVADWSRDAMRPSDAVWHAEMDKLVLRDLFDSNWLPGAEVQRMVWQQAFQGESVGDVLFGLLPDTGAMPDNHDEVMTAEDFATAMADQDAVLKEVNCEHDGVIYDTPCYYHQKVRDGLTAPSWHKPAIRFPSTYPTRFPYKPLRLTPTRTKREEMDDEAMKEHREQCLHCSHFDLENPWVVRARIAHWKGERAKFAADPEYKAKPYQMANASKWCPPGMVSHWRTVVSGGLLQTQLDEPVTVDFLSVLDTLANMAKGDKVPEREQKGSERTLRRALHSFGRYVKDSRKQFWADWADNQVVRNEVRMFKEDQSKVGTAPFVDGSIWVPVPGQIVRLRPNRVTDATGGKDRLRFSYSPKYLFPMLPDSRILPDNEHIEDVWVREVGPWMPGAERLTTELWDMMDAPIHVSNNGDASIDGVKGTFVYGLAGVIEHQRNVQNGRKVVKVLIDQSRLFLFSLVG